MSYMQQFAANPKRVLVVHATYDLTFLREFSLDVLTNFDRHKVDYVSKVLRRAVTTQQAKRPINISMAGI